MDGEVKTWLLDIKKAMQSYNKTKRLIIKYCFLLILSTLTKGSSAQTYSSLVNDQEIVVFLNAYTNPSHSASARFVKRRIVVADTSILNFPAVKTFFSVDDIIFLRKQIENSKNVFWEKNLVNWSLVGDNVKLNKFNRPAHTIFSYSIPLFSVDKKKAIIWEGFFCGLLCGGTQYTICQLQSTGEWNKVEEFDRWAE